jgi:hypothetical protein
MSTKLRSRLEQHIYCSCQALAWCSASIVNALDVTFRCARPRRAQASNPFRRIAPCAIAPGPATATASHPHQEQRCYVTPPRRGIGRAGRQTHTLRLPYSDPPPFSSGLLSCTFPAVNTAEPTTTQAQTDSLRKHFLRRWERNTPSANHDQFVRILPHYHSLLCQLIVTSLTPSTTSRA